MFDPATLALLARLKILGRQAGTNIDLVKMSEDKAYAEQTLKLLSNAEDSELVLIAVQLMNQFGMLKSPAGQARSEEGSGEVRYVGALR